MISFLGAAIGADVYYDRSGVHCRSITDSAKVLDALKDPEDGYYDPRDISTTVPRVSVLEEPIPNISLNLQNQDHWQEYELV